MEIVYPRVAGIDVGKREVAVAVRVPGDIPGERRQQIRKFKTFYPVLQQMVVWLAGQGVTHVVMEATGVYWKPVFHALCEAEPIEVLLVNARHVKNVPGRKTDVKDSAWLAQLLECGLLRGSFIPPKDIAAIRELTRYRKKLIESRTRELQRLSKVLEDGGIKIDSVASSTTTLSARDMIGIGDDLVGVAPVHADHCQVGEDACLSSDGQVAGQGVGHGCFSEFGAAQGGAAFLGQPGAVEPMAITTCAMSGSLTIRASSPSSCKAR